MNALETVFRGVLDLSWRASCLIVAVLALRALLRGRLSAQIIFWAWIAVAIRLLLPISFSAAWNPFNFAPFTHAFGPAIVPGSSGQIFQPIGATLPSLAGAATAALANERFFAWSKLTPGQWAVSIWAVGMSALLLARGWAYVRFVRKLRRSSSPLAAPLTLGVEPVGIDVIETDAVSAPALHGIFQPRLLLPRGFAEKLTPAELQHVVAHELAHDARRDLLAQVLMRTAVAVHWFNPLGWIAVRIARDDCELACDEAVLRRLTESQRETYGATLLKIITLANCGTPPPLGLGVVESKQQIKRRIQMIVAQPSRTFARTAFGCALFLVVTTLSLTRETRAQPSPAVSESQVRPAVRILPPDSSPPRFKYDTSTDGLDALFTNGVVATVGDKAVTVEEVRREMKPLVPQLQRQSGDQQDFDRRLSRLQHQVVGDLLQRAMLIKQFHRPMESGEVKQIPAEYVDNEIADRLKGQFDNDRTKLLAYLRDRGVTMADFRHEIEEEIIYHYMEMQERNLDKAMKTRSGPQVHLRMIQLKRADGETDATLLVKANGILARFKSGEAFETLAREFSEDTRREKGGDWGWMTADELKKDYSDMAFAMKVGDVSAPIILKEGGFLLFVEGRK